MVKVLVLSKHGGALTKRISLVDGTIKSDGSQCRMSAGTGRQVTVSLHEFAETLKTLDSNQAIALGALRDGVPDQVRVETKWSEKHVQFASGVRPDDLIARSEDYLAYRKGAPALVLIDVDSKGMPSEVEHCIAASSGDVWGALVTVLPKLAPVGRVVRSSTTTGLSRSDTGAALRGSDGLHIFLLVKDGGDAKRFLYALHDRCWLNGLGWMMIGEAGQFLRRSLIDRMVYAGERLVFEGAPVLDRPLVQDLGSRAPSVVEGSALDTLDCRDLTVVEKALLKELEEAEKRRLAPEAAKRRAAFIEKHAAKIVERTACKLEAARKMVERQCGGILLPAIVLPFDDHEGITVADVLADPDKYVGATLADPVEGIEYGPCKAMIMRRDDGSLWINSFAHGRAAYELKHDAQAVKASIMAAPEADAADVLVRMLPHSDTDDVDEDGLKAITCQRAGVRPRALGARIKAAKAETGRRHADDARDRAEAARTDPRLRLPVPLAAGERTPVMGALNDLLGAVDSPEPPMRDLEGNLSGLVVRQIPSRHVLTSDGANDEEPAEARIPVTEMPMLSRLSECEASELIERYIEFQDHKGHPVTLPSAFVKHYIQRNDNRLPICSALATLPMVTANGQLLAKQGLDRDRGILFRIPEDLLAELPKSRDEFDDAAITCAMQFLVDNWMIDVATDLTGVCVLLSAAASIIQRSMLSNRPVFLVTAPRRGGGKTTALSMITSAVTGIRPAAAAWSTNEEERRKSLMAYLLEALPAIVWDNISRGTQISCPHIEKACTAEFLSDRKLGVSENIIVSAAPINLFTGNALALSGDLASRGLTVMLRVDRPDPENRTFRNPDPIEWTNANRNRILASLFTVMLGNPALKSNAQQPTRFKDWMRMIGSAFEHGAKLYKADAIRRGETDPVILRQVATDDHVPAAEHIPDVNFGDLFRGQDDEDEQLTDLAMTLHTLGEVIARHPVAAAKNYGDGVFDAAHLAQYINDQSNRTNEENADSAILLEFFYPEHPPANTKKIVFTPMSLGKRLKRHLNEPVRHGKLIMTLKEMPKTFADSHHAPAKYRVEGYVAATKGDAKAEPPPQYTGQHREADVVPEGFDY